MRFESLIEEQELERSWRRSEGFELIIEDLVRKGSALRQIRRHNIYFFAAENVWLVGGLLLQDPCQYCSTELYGVHKVQ
jgi:hypothetical protein